MEKYFPAAWAWLYNKALQCILWITGDITIPAYLGVVLILFSSGFLLGCILILKAKLSQTLHWKSYTSDNFYGVTWRWRYSYTDDIFGLHCFCPKCYMLVDPHHNYLMNRYDFYCKRCASLKGYLETRDSNLNEIIIREVDRTIRSGEWVEKVKSS